VSNHTLWVGKWIGTATIEPNTEVAWKRKSRTSIFYPDIPLFSIRLKQSKAAYDRDCWRPVFINVYFTSENYGLSLDSHWRMSTHRKNSDIYVYILYGIMECICTYIWYVIVYVYIYIHHLYKVMSLWKTWMELDIIINKPVLKSYCLIFS
jgi:hypothetical protein